MHLYACMCARIYAIYANDDGQTHYAVHTHIHIYIYIHMTGGRRVCVSVCVGRLAARAV